MTAANYRLSSELHGHEQDVRAVATLPNGCVVTGSRDRTARLWERQTDPIDAFVAIAIYAGAQHFVSSVCYAPATAEYPEGLVFTGSNDKKIRAYSGTSAEPIMTLEGHTDTVSCLAAGPDGTLVSGSWDKTLRIWRGNQCVKVLSGHSLAVWAVCVLDNGNIVSAAADKQIKIWHDGSCIKTITGHSDAVRGLCTIPGLGFASCSNDSSVRTWTNDGSALTELHGHTSFVYSVCCVGGDMLASCGEDRCVKIWRGEQCVQTIAHPCPSVWAVAALPNGDIVSAGSDGLARVFTEAEERVAPQHVLEKFSEDVASSTISAKQLGDISKEDLPGPAALSQPGSREGQTKLVRQPNGKVECYQWTMAGGWMCLGEVVDAVGSGQKQLYEGKEYDYVFDIDIGDGVPHLKLPYNITENPYMAAQEFLYRNELDQVFLDQVAQFIIKNTQGAQLGGGAVAADPFTGGGAYTSGSGGVAAGASSFNPDPFTGGGAYTTGAASAPRANGGTTSIAGGVADPFTGGNAYSTGAAEAPAKRAKTVSGAAHYPLREYVTFTEAKVPGIVKKIAEFNGNMPADLQLSAAEVDSIQTMANAFSAGSHGPAFAKMLMWSRDQLFPVLDLARLVCLQSEGAAFLAQQAEFTAAVVDIVKSAQSSAPNLMLACRYVANSFAQKSTREAVAVAQSEALIGGLTAHSAHDNRNVRVAMATAVMNYAVMYHVTGAGAHGVTDRLLQCLSAISHILATENDAEVLYRTLVGLGTLVAANQDMVDMAKMLELEPLVRSHVTSDASKVAECASALEALLK